MPENFYFGGGASGSAMRPAVMALSALAVILVLFLPRKYVYAPILGIAVLTPFGAQLSLGGFHLYTVRILVLAGACRLAFARLLRAEAVFSGGFTAFDGIFIAWAVCRGMALIILLPEAGAVVNQVAFWIDTIGLYILFRHTIQDGSDLVRAIKTTAVLVAAIAVCMVYEQETHFNIFNLINSYHIVPWLREGQVRAQASFGHSITAGIFAATPLALFFWLWKSGKARIFGIVGVVASLLGTVASVSSTPVSACLGGFVGLSLWSIRAHMRKVRWGIVLTILALAVVMKAPIFYIIAKVDFVGGHGWDRAFLVDQFVQHLSDWWLVGTDQNGTWSHGTWDRCNQYVAEAASGGVITLGLFIALISRGFGIAGRARKRSSGKQAWLAWCIGSALFAHVVAFQGVSYWDQMKVPWLLFLAMFPPLDCMTPGGRAATGDKATSGDTPVSAPPEGAGEATGAAQRVLA